MRDGYTQAALPGVCLWCGAGLDKVRTDAHYCSAAHKQAHYRWRQRLNKLAIEASVAINKVAEYQNYPNKRLEAREVLTMLQQQVKSSLRAGTK